MKKYLELFKDGFDETIEAKIKPENWPYIGYSPSEGVKFTSISRPTCFAYTTSDGSLFDLQGILDFWMSLYESNNIEVSLGASVVSNTYNDTGKIVLNTTINKLGLSEDNILFPIFTTSIFGSNEDPYNITKLTSIELPDTITFMANGTFYSCTGLQHVTLPKGLININPSVFYSCTALQDINIPDSITSIGKWAFQNCSSLTSITIPNSVTSIGEEAFDGCSSLTSITIPNSITNIGDGAFSGCTSLTSIIIGAGIQSEYPGNWGDGGVNGWFYNCPNIETIVVDNNNPIYDSRDNCNALIETSTNALLLGCGNTTIPNSVEIIKDNAFKGCKNLNTIEISEGIKTIYSNAFNECSSLKTVIWKTNNYVTNDYSSTSSPFRFCSLTSFIIGKNIINIPQGICYNQKKLSQVHIPEGVLSIGDNAFRECTALKSITIPASIQNIGRIAFAGCTSLKKTSYLGTITDWCKLTFTGSGKAFANNPVYFSGNLYINDIEIKDLIIPNNVPTIGGYNFIGCKALNSIVISESVTNIGTGSFYDCTNVQTITYNGTVEQWGLITLGSNWNKNVPATYVQCTDGQVPL